MPPIKKKLKDLFTKTDEQKIADNLKQARAKYAEILKLEKSIDQLIDNPNFRSQYTDQVDDTLDKAKELAGSLGIKDEEEEENTQEDSQDEEDAPAPPVHDITTSAKAVKTADEILKELKEYTKKIEKELAAFRSNEQNLSNGSLIRKALTTQYMENEEFLKKHPGNPLVVLAQKQIKRIINGLARAKDEEIGLLRQMASSIMLGCQDEIKKVKAGKAEDLQDDHLDARRDNLSDILDELEEELNNLKLPENVKKDTEEDEDEEIESNDTEYSGSALSRGRARAKPHESKYVLNPPGEDVTPVDKRYNRNWDNNLEYDPQYRRFVDTYLRDKIDKADFEYIESLHDGIGDDLESENFTKLMDAIAETTSTLKSLYLMRTRNPEQETLLKQEEIRAEFFLSRLKLYEDFLDSVAYNTGNLLNKRLDKMKDAREGLEKAQGFKRPEKLGYLGDLVEVVAQEGLRLTPTSKDDKDEATAPGFSSEDKLKDSPTFDPKTQARVIRHFFKKKDLGVADGTNDPNQEFVTVQYQLGGRTLSHFQYSREDVEKLSKHDQLILAIRECENLLRDMKRPYKSPTLRGDWPSSFVQNIVDYMDLKGVTVHNHTTDSKKFFKDKTSTVTPGPLSKRLLALELEKKSFREEVFGKDVPLDFKQNERKRLQKATQSTAKQLEKFVTTAKPGHH